MKTFKQLEVGDKLFIYVDNPSYSNRWYDSPLWTDTEFVNSVYLIKEIYNQGFCKRFVVDVIIGTDCKAITIASEKVTTSRKMHGVTNQQSNKLYFYQKLTITTDENEWAENLNKDEV